jgi:hypothetical protein
MYLGKAAEGNRTELAGRERTSLYVGTVGYRIGNKAQNTS